MNWYKIFYWMGVADNVSLVLNIIWVLSLAAVGVSTIGYFMCTTSLRQHVVKGGPEAQSTEYNEWLVWNTTWKRIWTTTFIVSIITIVAWTFVPTKKQLITIIAGGAIGNFVTTDSSSRAIPAELTRYVRNYLKKEAEDLDEDTRKELGVQTPKEEFIDKLKTLSKEQIIEALKKDTMVKGE